MIFFTRKKAEKVGKTQRGGTYHVIRRMPRIEDDEFRA